jgi:hypothetical protein
VLALRYPIADCDIQHGAQLTVREGQAIVFMAEGRFADHLGPGLHTLDIATLPLLTVLENWDTGFAAPFKSDIFYFSRREQIDRKQRGGRYGNRRGDGKRPCGGYRCFCGIRRPVCGDRQALCPDDRSRADPGRWRMAIGPPIDAVPVESGESVILCITMLGPAEQKVINTDLMP